MGWVTGPPLALEASPEYDLRSRHLVAWISHLLESGLLDSLVVRPPVADFSMHRRPVLRSFARPQGATQKSLGLLDNSRAEAAIFLFRHAVLVGVPAVLLQPGSSVMTCLPSWKATLGREGVVQQIWGCPLALTRPAALGALTMAALSSLSTPLFQVVLTPPFA